mgnify:FL=1
MHNFPLSRLLIIAIASAGLAACGGNAPVLNVPVSAANAFFLTTENSIVGVDVDDMKYARSVSTLPQATTADTAGALDPLETVLDIDYRNSEGALYALTKTGTKGRIIRIDPSSGNFTRISTLVNDGTTTNMSLPATSYTIDFNPVVDRLRIIGSDGSNWRADVSTGDTLVDTPTTVINLSGAAYEDTFSALGRGTRLFTLDATTDSVYLQDPPNDGKQTAAKSLLGSTDVASIDGYDINPANNVGLAMMTVAGVQRVYTINPAASIGSNAASLVDSPPALTGSFKYKALTFITRANPTVLALTSSNRYHSFNANQPDQISNPASITVPSGETVLGFDMRQSDRKLYALTSASKLYTVDLATPAATAPTPAGGTATLVSTLSLPLISGVSYTLDFNPLIAATGSASNRMRLIGNDDSNATVEVETGTVSTSTVVSGTPNPTIVAAAYINNFRNIGSTTPNTRLFVIDSANGTINEQNITAGDPLLGTLTRISSLGITLAGRVGFDISGQNNDNILLMAHGTEPGISTLYRLGSSLSSTASFAPTGMIGGSSGPTDLIDIAIRF